MRTKTEMTPLEKELREIEHTERVANAYALKELLLRAGVMVLALIGVVGMLFAMTFLL